MVFGFLKGKKHFSSFRVSFKTPEGNFSRIIDRKEFTIGRSSECSFQFQNPDLSRVHLLVSVHDDEVFVMDMESSNGTYVDGKRLPAKQKQAVNPQQTVRLGKKNVVELNIEAVEKWLPSEEIKKIPGADKIQMDIQEILDGAKQAGEREVFQAQEYAHSLRRSAVEEKERKVLELQSFEQQQRELVGQRIFAYEENLRAQADEIIHQANQKAEQMVSDRLAFVAQEENRIRQLAEHEQKRMEHETLQMREQVTREVQKMLQQGKEDAHQLRLRQIQDWDIEKADLEKNYITQLQEEHSNLRSEIERLKNETLQSQNRFNQQIEEQRVMFEKNSNDQKARLERENEDLKLQLKEQLKASLSDLQNEIEEFNRRKQQSEKDYQDQLSAQQQAFSERTEKLTKEFEEKNKDLQAEHEQAKSAKMQEMKNLEEDARRNMNERILELEEKLLVLKKEQERLNEAGEREVQRRKEEIAEAQAISKKEIEKYQAQLAQQTQKDLDEKLKQARQQLLENEGQVKASLAEIETLKGERRKFAEQRESEFEKLKTLESETVEKQKILDSLDREINRSKNLIAESESEQLKNKKMVESQEELLYRLQGEIKNYEEQVQQLKGSFDKEISQLKSQHQIQIQELNRTQESARAQLLQAETERIKKETQALWGEFQKTQSEFGNRIHQSLMKELVNVIPREGLRKIEMPLKENITKVLHETLAQTTTSVAQETLVVSDLQKQAQMRSLRWASVGVMLGVLGFWSFIKANDYLHSRSVASVLAEEQKQRKDDLEARKFEPEMNNQIRETYTDSVIYTRNFAKLYADPTVQDRWVKEARTYFFRVYQMPEENVMGAIAKVQSLVQSLQDLRLNIHPDFVKENIQKMRELEAESLQPIRDQFGTEVKYLQFKKMEKDFFEKEILSSHE
jgi:pSer/pThr/pTyr-binding forkhead associated (FHA) protein